MLTVSVTRTWAAALMGVQGYVVQVEADVSTGMPGLSIIGLPDTSLVEARDRVRAAITNSGHGWPSKKMTLGLSPAALPKSGSAFDLALALAILGAADTPLAEALVNRTCIGELGLDGTVRPVRGVLPLVAASVQAGRPRVMVPVGNAAEASLVPGAQVEAVDDLRRAVAVCLGTRPSCEVPDPGPGRPVFVPDLADVVGQPRGRQAVEVAAAGGHHLFLLGPPGTGKTMLAERLPGLLPPLTDAHALEVTGVHSAAGELLGGAGALVRRPPFRAPHHTATVAALVGGGSGALRPGMASMAHRGVLFLDEAPEFQSGVLDALRQPLESGVITVARARATAVFPARFQLVVAANPCPCSGTRPDGGCECPSATRRRYLGRLSGPLLDRVDLQVAVDPVGAASLLTGETSEGTAAVAARVVAARAASHERWGGQWATNSEVPGPELRGRWSPPARALRPALEAVRRGRLTVRGVDRVLRVAWTLADLDGSAAPGAEHVQAACGLRGLVETMDLAA